MGNQMLRRRRPWFVQAVLPAYLGGAAAYLIWRATLTIGWNQWYLWLLWSSEFASVAFTIAYLATSRRTDVPIRRAPPVGKIADIFIPTYNEPEDIVKMTTIGALHVRGVRKVFVLDDGCRVNIHAMATSLGAEYISRSDNTHAKAGNMNAGILHSDAEFMLFLDCDHVPQPQIIERTLGYFRRSPARVRADATAILQYR